MKIRTLSFSKLLLAVLENKKEKKITENNVGNNGPLFKNKINSNRVIELQSRFEIRIIRNG